MTDCSFYYYSRVEKGWSLNPLQFPPCFHICMTLMHTQEGVVETFLEDIRYGPKETFRSIKPRLSFSCFFFRKFHLEGDPAWRQIFLQSLEKCSTAQPWMHHLWIASISLDYRSTLGLPLYSWTILSRRVREFVLFVMSSLNLMNNFLSIQFGMGAKPSLFWCLSKLDFFQKNCCLYDCK